MNGAAAVVIYRHLNTDPTYLTRKLYADDGNLGIFERNFHN